MDSAWELGGGAGAMGVLRQAVFPTPPRAMGVGVGTDQEPAEVTVASPRQQV